MFAAAVGAGLYASQGRGSVLDAAMPVRFCRVLSHFGVPVAGPVPLISVLAGMMRLVSDETSHASEDDGYGALRAERAFRGMMSAAVVPLEQRYEVVEADCVSHAIAAALTVVPVRDAVVTLAVDAPGGECGDWWAYTREAYGVWYAEGRFEEGSRACVSEAADPPPVALGRWACLAVLSPPCSEDARGLYGISGYRAALPVGAVGGRVRAAEGDSADTGGGTGAGNPTQAA